MLTLLIPSIKLSGRPPALPTTVMSRDAEKGVPWQGQGRGGMAAGTGQVPQRPIAASAFAGGMAERAPLQNFIL